MSLRRSVSNKLVKQLTLFLIHFPLYVNSVKEQRISISLHEAYLCVKLEMWNCEKRLSVREYLTAAVLNYVQKLTSQSSVVLDFRSSLYFLHQ
jgi:hypothetical protein